MLKGLQGVQLLHYGIRQYLRLFQYQNPHCFVGDSCDCRYLLWPMFCGMLEQETLLSRERNRGHEEPPRGFPAKAIHFLITSFGSMFHALEI